MLTTVLAFLVAIGALIAIHEYGHFQVARWCGVKVLRFSVGFGRPVLRWQRKGDATEFVLGALPLGGYVRMLDEREAPVDPSERHLAFNTQPVHKRFAIVAAGPVANLLLAVLLYAGVAWYGVPEARPVVAEPPLGSMAAKAGLQSGDTVRSLRGAGEDEAQPVHSLEQLRWQLVQAALNHEDVVLEVQHGGAGAKIAQLVLPLQQAGFTEAGADMLDQIGIAAPWMAPVVGEVTPGQPADKAGLKPGDTVRRIDAVAIQDAAQLRRLIRSDVSGQPQQWQIDRAGDMHTLSVLPQVVQDGSARFGRIGAYLGAPPAMTKVRYGNAEQVPQDRAIRELPTNL